MLVLTAPPFSFIPFCVLCILCRVRVLVFIFKIYSRPHNGHFKGNIMDLMLYSSIQFFLFFLFTFFVRCFVTWFIEFILDLRFCNEKKSL